MTEQGQNAIAESKMLTQMQRKYGQGKVPWGMHPLSPFWQKEIQRKTANEISRLKKEKFLRVQRAIKAQQRFRQSNK